jgi:hypothetical protein
MKHPDLISLLNTITLPQRDLTRADLVHANAQKAHKPNGLIIRLEKHDGAGCRGREVALACSFTGGIDAF